MNRKRLTVPSNEPGRWALVSIYASCGRVAELGVVRPHSRLIDIICNLIFLVLVGLISFAFELIFFGYYAPKDHAEMAAFITREKGKALIGLIVCGVISG
jgi:hypothetical protein